MKPKVSIIVPVYNAKNTISRMIDSLINQSLQEIEILLVDDGSTDGSSEILDSYQKRDSRIQVFHKENGGVATARQYGVEQASGKYSIHADSDDWVDSQMLEDLYTKAEEEQADIVIADYYMDFDEGETQYKKQSLSTTDSRKVLENILSGNLHGSLCNKLMRHDLYQTYHAQFFNGINYCEDVLIWAQILKSSDLKIAYAQKAYYHYCINRASITHQINRASYNGLLAYKEKLNQILTPNEQYRSCLTPVSFMIFHEGFCAKGVMTDTEISSSFKDIESYAFQHSSIRWKFGFFCVKYGFYEMGRRLLRY